MSTVRGPPFRTNPRGDAEALHCALNNVPPGPNSPSFFQAMSVVGCDEAAVVKILAHRDAKQRARIRVEYKAMCGVDLLDCLSRNLSGKLKKSVLLWMRHPVERDAIVVKRRLSTMNLKAAAEVICSRTPSEIRSFKRQYHSRFGVLLQDDIRRQTRQTSRDHQALLLACVNAPCDEGLKSGRERAVEDSRALFEAVVGTDEETFINIFSEQSRAQLAALISAYHNADENSLEMAVKGKKLEPFEYAFWTILSFSKNPARYFAKVLRKAMKCLGTHSTLIWVIVTRAEIDMQDIKAEYLRKYKKTLYDAVRDAVHLESGHYRNFLLSLLGGKH